MNTTDNYHQAARDHLWMHFTRHSTYEQGGDVPVLVRGEGCYVWDDRGKRYVDGLAGLFVVQAGHGRTELAEAAAKQAADLAYFPIWSFAHPRAVELAERLAALTPGDLNRVFFTTGGGEAVETAWKLAKQYFKLVGKPSKHKVISRDIAYHGTPHGALSIDITDEEGVTRTWILTTGSINVLTSAGVSATGPDRLRVGQVIQVSFNPALNGSNLGFLRSMTLPDKREVEFAPD
jgi:adenosylmethionine-8-amino-7-oxononanoate aminotransferase